MSGEVDYWWQIDEKLMKICEQMGAQRKSIENIEKSIKETNIKIDNVCTDVENIKRERNMLVGSYKTVVLLCSAFGGFIVMGLMYLKDILKGMLWP